jgi:hypothetical protein
MNLPTTTGITLFLLLAAPVGLPAADQGTPPLSWGGDLRARVVSFDRIPTEAGMVWSENRFFRFRSRLWGSYDLTPRLSFTGRLVNEWREYAHDKGSNTYQALDEVVIDNAYLDLKNLCNHRLDLRIGRQDLRYGTGKIIMIGTPLDSSRTTYLNAVKASLHLEPLQIDFLALLVDAEDELAIHSQDRTLVEGDENGGGLYIKNHFFATVPQEYYYLYKHEQRADNLDFHTVGLRFMPKFSTSLSATIEVAHQDGHRQHGGSLGGELFDISLFYALPAWRAGKARFDLSYYYLSGDDPGTSEDEGWHPLWARQPQYMSYTMVRAQVPAFAAWSNISMPSAGFELEITPHLSLKTRLALVYAPEEGPGGGNQKGTLFISRLSYKIAAAWSGNVHIEVLDPDDYYADTNHLGHYGHVELMYHF